MKPPASLTTPWAEIVKGNRAIGNGLQLEFVYNTGEAIISDEEWEEGAQLWKHPLICEVKGTITPYTEMLKWASNTWKNQTPSISQLKPGIFLFDFHSEEQKLDVLRKEWTYYFKYAVMFKPWGPDKDVDVQCVESTPLWIQFPGLPPRLWSSKSLSKIVTCIGTPLAANKMTAQRTKLDFARVLIDVKSTDNLPNVVLIVRSNGMKFYQEVLYERDMPRCAHYHFIGHEIDQCRRRKHGNEKKEAAGSVNGKSEILVDGKQNENFAAEASKPVTLEVVRVEDTPTQP